MNFMLSAAYLSLPGLPRVPVRVLSLSPSLPGYGLAVAAGSRLTLHGVAAVSHAYRLKIIDDDSIFTV